MGIKSTLVGWVTPTITNPQEETIYPEGPRKHIKVYNYGAKEINDIILANNQYASQLQAHQEERQRQIEHIAHQKQLKKEQKIMKLKQKKKQQRKKQLEDERRREEQRLQARKARERRQRERQAQEDRAHARILEVQNRIEQDRLHQERLEQERLQQERLEQERLQQERLEQERLQQAQREMEQERHRQQELEHEEERRRRIRRQRRAQRLDERIQERNIQGGEFAQHARQTRQRHQVQINPHQPRYSILPSSPRQNNQNNRFSQLNNPPLDEEIPPYRPTFHKYLDLMSFDPRYTPVLRVNKNLIKSHEELKVFIGKFQEFNVFPESIDPYELSLVDDRHFDDLIPQLIPDEYGFVNHPTTNANSFSMPLPAYRNSLLRNNLILHDLNNYDTRSISDENLQLALAILDSSRSLGGNSPSSSSLTSLNYNPRIQLPNYT